MNRIHNSRYRNSSRVFSLPPQLEEGHEVHPLVLRLLEEGVDPAVVLLHPAEGLEVPDHPPGKARHPRHRLQKDGPEKKKFKQLKQVCRIRNTVKYLDSMVNFVFALFRRVIPVNNVDNGIANNTGIKNVQ